MTDSHSPQQFAGRLLQQEPIFQSPRYQEHRMELELQLQRAERNEKLAERVAMIAFVVGVAAIVPTATKVFGEPDPFNKDWTFLAMMVGLLYGLGMITFWLSVAMYLGRFRPAVKRAKERLLFESIRELRQEVQEIRRLMDETSDKPKA